MTDIEILKNYENAHKLSIKLGLSLRLNQEHFEVLSDGDIIYKKMKLPGVVDFLTGYEAALSRGK